MRGKFITFEGGEGTGKSTQAAMLALRLESLGLAVQLTREPGGSPGAEIIRHVLLSGAAKPFGPEVEAMLFAAARDDHVQCTILPALEAGKWVICDRFADSTRVYQGVLGKVDERLIKGLERVSIGSLAPDLTIILDVPVELGLERIKQRPPRPPTGSRPRTWNFIKSCARRFWRSRPKTRAVASSSMPVPPRKRSPKRSGMR